MSEETASVLRRRRKLLLRKLPPLESVLRGSLIERYKRCGKPGCKCAEGPGHGPKYYLSVSYPGRAPQMDYVPQACCLPRLIANHRQFCCEVVHRSWA